MDEKDDEGNVVNLSDFRRKGESSDEYKLEATEIDPNKVNVSHFGVGLVVKDPNLGFLLDADNARCLGLRLIEAAAVWDVTDWGDDDDSYDEE